MYKNRLNITAGMDNPVHPGQTYGSAPTGKQHFYLPQHRQYM